MAYMDSADLGRFGAFEIELPFTPTTRQCYMHPCNNNNETCTQKHADITGRPLH